MLSYPAKKSEVFAKLSCLFDSIFSGKKTQSRPFGFTKRIVHKRRFSQEKQSHNMQALQQELSIT